MTSDFEALDDPLLDASGKNIIFSFPHITPFQQKHTSCQANLNSMLDTSRLSYDTIYINLLTPNVAAVIVEDMAMSF